MKKLLPVAIVFLVQLPILDSNAQSLGSCPLISEDTSPLKAALINGLKDIASKCATKEDNTAVLQQVNKLASIAAACNSRFKSEEYLSALNQAKTKSITEPSYSFCSNREDSELCIHNYYKEQKAVSEKSCENAKRTSSTNERSVQIGELASSLFDKILLADASSNPSQNPACGKNSEYAKTALSSAVNLSSLILQGSGGSPQAALVTLIANQINRVISQSGKFKDLGNELAGIEDTTQFNNMICLSHYGRVQLCTEQEVASKAKEFRNKGTEVSGDFATEHLLLIDNDQSNFLDRGYSINLIYIIDRLTKNAEQSRLEPGEQISDIKSTASRAAKLSAFCKKSRSDLEYLYLIYKFSGSTKDENGNFSEPKLAEHFKDPELNAQFKSLFETCLSDKNMSAIETYYLAFQGVEPKEDGPAKSYFHAWQNFKKRYVDSAFYNKPSKATAASSIQYYLKKFHQNSKAENIIEADNGKRELEDLKHLDQLERSKITSYPAPKLSEHAKQSGSFPHPLLSLSETGKSPLTESFKEASPKFENALNVFESSKSLLSSISGSIKDRSTIQETGAVSTVSLLARYNQVIANPVQKRLNELLDSANGINSSNKNADKKISIREWSYIQNLCMTSVPLLDLKTRQRCQNQFKECGLLYDETFKPTDVSPINAQCALLKDSMRLKCNSERQDKIELNLSQDPQSEKVPIETFCKMIAATESECKRRLPNPASKNKNDSVHR